MASIDVGVEAFNAFLQANVTGPVLSEEQAQLARPYEGEIDLRLSSLEVDGVSPYPFIPHIDLFCLAKHSIEDASPEAWTAAGCAGDISLAWMRLRLHVWHYKLFIEPSLSPGSIFTKNIGMSEVPTLVERIQDGLRGVESDVLGGGEKGEAGPSRWPAEAKVRFLLEKASICIMLGQDVQARDALAAAAGLNGFVYALSGALGKRTRFQEKGTSQLVVLARSGTPPGPGAPAQEPAPEALPLNDDTLLEDIEYAKAGEEGLHGEQDRGGDPGAQLPPALRGLRPDEQPQLSALDQIILLTQATLKDSFSPADKLTAEEVLPFAVRVISDRSTNWQIYTQALLVRSRIEQHRSRTVERGVLQMQAVVDQVIVDTTQKPAAAAAAAEEEEEEGRRDGTAQDAPEVPSISVSAPDAQPRPRQDRRDEAAPAEEKPKSFFPAAKPEESAPAPVRLAYIHALSSPPRWHLESELAYAWTGVGSLVSALEIFKRLKLWAEVALCLASSASTDNEDGSGRGGGGEDKARAVIRWRLYHRRKDAQPGGPAADDDDDDDGDENDALDEDTDITTLRAESFTGSERTPPQPNAPRLFCILGDIESGSAVAHYERAWEISGHRYARAQKSLGEHYLSQKDWARAREAYQLAVSVNRLSPEMWSRLGDINLRLGDFAAAAEAFTRSIGSSNDSSGGEDARTWSNLGSALYSMYLEAVESDKKETSAEGAPTETGAGEGRADNDDDDDDKGATSVASSTAPPRNPSLLLAQSMKAYKRGASIAHDNWRIWDNVITLATRMRPMPFFEIIQALRSIIRIRQSEDALDDGILRVLLTEGVLAADRREGDTGAGQYEPPRGSVERNVNEMMEREVVPLITNRSELWELLSRLRAWRRDYAGAIDASEKAWRAAVGGATSGAGSMGGGLTVDDAAAAAAAAAARKGGEGAQGGSSRNWLESKEAWLVVVQRTDELVAVLENFGPQVDEVGDRWRGKARSALRSVMGKGKEAWEGSEGWDTLKGLLDGLKAS